VVDAGVVDAGVVEVLAIVAMLATLANANAEPRVYMELKKPSSSIYAGQSVVGCPVTRTDRSGFRVVVRPHGQQANVATTRCETSVGGLRGVLAGCGSSRSCGGRRGGAVIDVAGSAPARGPQTAWRPGPVGPGGREAASGRCGAGLWGCSRHRVLVPATGHR
jgi:hypothetical protein